MKKYVTISLFIFWAIVVAVIVAGLISRDDSKFSNVSNTTDVTTGTSSNTTNKALILNMSEIIKHNSAKSCWLLVSSKIYDVTNFLNQHPGNASTILPTCGTDATAAYASRGGTGSHSSSARAMLDAYFIGNLNETVGTNSTKTANLPVPNPILPSKIDDDDDDDD